MITIVPPAVMNQSAWHMHTQYGITQWWWLALVPPRSNEYIINQNVPFGDLEPFAIVVVVTYIFM